MVRSSSELAATRHLSIDDGIKTMVQVKRRWCYRGGSVESVCGYGR
jgi:hypothetical protein